MRYIVGEILCLARGFIKSYIENIMVRILTIRKQVKHCDIMRRIISVKNAGMRRMKAHFIGVARL